MPPGLVDGRDPRPDGAKPRTVRLAAAWSIGRAAGVRAPGRRHVRVPAARPALREERLLVRRGPGLDERHVRERPAAGRAGDGAPGDRCASAPRCWSSGDEDRRSAPRPTSAASARATRTRTSSSRPLYAVADGMGGHRGGDVASSLALETIEELFRERRGHARRAGPRARTAPCASARRPTRAVQRHGHDAHGRRWSRAPSRSIAHVGDSRAYLLRAGDLRQLTDDHTLVARMVKAGEIPRRRPRCTRTATSSRGRSAPRPTVAVDEDTVRAARRRPAAAVQRRAHRHGDRGSDPRRSWRREPEPQRRRRPPGEGGEPGRRHRQHHGRRARRGRRGRRRRPPAAAGRCRRRCRARGGWSRAR